MMLNYPQITQMHADKKTLRVTNRQILELCRNCSLGYANTWHGSLKNLWIIPISTDFICVNLRHLRINSRKCWA